MGLSPFSSPDVNGASSSIEALLCTGTLLRFSMMVLSSSMEALLYTGTLLRFSMMVLASSMKSLGYSSVFGLCALSSAEDVYVGSDLGVDW